MSSQRITFNAILHKLPRAFPKDARSIAREIQRLRKKGNENNALQTKLVQLDKRTDSSIRKRERRRLQLPQPRYLDHLPITARKKDIIAAIRQNPVIVVSGETGSGKTTQIPKFCLAAGRGVDGRIGCTQPRRIAATTVARRIAEEFGESVGRSIGYKIRFSDKVGKQTCIKIMTDGILLAEAQGDRFLNEYDTIIVDEAHERSLNIDFILGMLKSLLDKRKDLKIIITSATIDTEKFSAAFNKAPVIEVHGRMFPVDVQYSPFKEGSNDNGELTYVDAAASETGRILRETRSGDVLIFMPTEQDIRDACELVEAKRYRNTTVYPLFARLPAADQARIFTPARSRKVIIATNVAETSITIPGIRYVIDSGLARMSRYSPRSRITSLPVTPISKSSADQRKGRCGRVENGICVRLYAEEDFATRSKFTPPEILRTNLAEVILRMMSLNIGSMTSFPFIDRPTDKSIADGYNLLEELGAIRKRKKKKTATIKKGKIKPDSDPYVLTENGRLMAKLPIDPRLSRMLVAAADSEYQDGVVTDGGVTDGVLMDDVLIIASALSIRDPRERPAEKAEAADRAHRAFAHPSSDFLTLINIWDAFHDVIRKRKTRSQQKKFCRASFLSYTRMREWMEIYRQIRTILKEIGLDRARPPCRGQSRKDPAGEYSEKRYDAVHQAVLTGFLANIALKKDKNIFQAAKGKEVMIFPGSSIFNQAGQWIVSAEQVETSRLFARTAATIKSEWLEKLGGFLCKYTYLDPHWEKNRQAVMATEQVSLFGLIIVPQRKVPFGKINGPAATDIFIRDALVKCDVKKPLAFMVHNQKCISQIEDMENKIRKRDILVSEADIAAFYAQHLKGIYDIRGLKKWIKKQGGDQCLRIPKDALFRYLPDDQTLAQYPDSIDLGNQPFACLYRFNPGREDDGMTIRIPENQASLVPPAALDWMVPGLYKEKVAALIKGLPKEYRKRLVPLADTVAFILKEMAQEKAPLINTLGKFIHRRFGIDIPASAWPENTLPDHLRPRISITGASGKEIRSGRDKNILQADGTAPRHPKEFLEAKKHWERENLQAWDFDDLPQSIDLDIAGNKTMQVFPALTADTNNPTAVHLRLFTERRMAMVRHRAGVAALYALAFKKEIKYLKKSLVLTQTQKDLAKPFGGRNAFELKLYAKVIADMFGKNIRTRNEFISHGKITVPRLIQAGRSLLEKSVAILKAYQQTSQRISRLEATHRSRPTALGMLDRLHRDLAKLLPENFIDLYGPERFEHLIRYAQTIAIRAERAVDNREKDRTKAQQVEYFMTSLQDLLKDLSPASSEEKREAIEAFFWMIEEYKVSIYAQELKTAFPVSKKRLEKKLEEIRRLR